MPLFFVYFFLPLINPVSGNVAPGFELSAINGRYYKVLLLNTGYNASKESCESHGDVGYAIASIRNAEDYEAIMSVAQGDVDFDLVVWRCRSI